MTGHVKFSGQSFNFSRQSFRFSGQNLSFSRQNYNFRAALPKPLLQSISDYKIALHINETEQKQRILKRNGEFMWEKFKTLWIPQENAYFNHFQIFDTCDVVLELQGHGV